MQSVAKQSGPVSQFSLARPALAVQLADTLRDMIMEGELPAGEKIKERELTLRFGVSRTPLREAMKVLAAEGLIDLIPNRGAIVTQYSAEELADIFPILAALERLAGELAAKRGSDEQIARIVTLTRELRVAVDHRDRPQYFMVNQAIHAEILSATGNEWLVKHHAAIASRIHRARYQANLKQTRWETALIEHERIADALKARDGARVGTLLHDHMMAKLSSILSVLDDANG